MAEANTQEKKSSGEATTSKPVSSTTSKTPPQRGGQRDGYRPGGRGSRGRGGFKRNRRNNKPRPKRPEDIVEWIPKTELGRAVKTGQIASYDEILAKRLKVLEPEIIDHFFPELQTDFFLTGQSKGKFGGGQRRVYKTTQKKIREGSRTKFTYVAIVGNGDGYIGVGKGSSRESLAARNRAVKAAKLNLIRILRGCGSWECGCASPHTLPLKVKGSAGSIRLILKPAPRGTGLVTNDESKKILTMAGVKDVWTESYGDTRSRINLAYATFDALKNTLSVAIPEKFAAEWGVN